MILNFDPPSSKSPEMVSWCHPRPSNRSVSDCWYRYLRTSRTPPTGSPPPRTCWKLDTWPVALLGAGSDGDGRGGVEDLKHPRARRQRIIASRVVTDYLLERYAKRGFLEITSGRTPVRGIFGYPDPRSLCGTGGGGGDRARAVHSAQYYQNPLVFHRPTPDFYLTFFFAFPDLPGSHGFPTHPVVSLCAFFLLFFLRLSVRFCAGARLADAHLRSV